MIGVEFDNYKLAKQTRQTRKSKRGIISVGVGETLSHSVWLEFRALTISNPNKRATYTLQTIILNANFGLGLYL